MEYSKSLNSNQVHNSGSIDREEYSDIRKKVQVVTQFVDKRKKAILRIQKMWRGYSVRKNFLKIKKRLREEKLYYYQRRQKRDYMRKYAIEIICRGIWRKRKKNAILMQKYVNLCATLIQKTFRGFTIRRQYKAGRRKLKWFLHILEAFIQGFKIRKIMRHPKIVRIIFEIKEMIRFQTTLESDNSFDSSTLRESIPQRIKKKKIQLLEQIDEMKKIGSWVNYSKELDMSKRELNTDRRNSSISSILMKNNERDLTFDGLDKSFTSPNKNNESRNQELSSERVKTQPDSRSGRDSRRINHWEQRRNNSRSLDKSDEFLYQIYGAPNLSSERKRNAWEERENTPIKGKINYTVPEMLLEEEEIISKPTKAKKTFLKKTVKYDPKSSIEREKLHKTLENEKKKSPSTSKEIEFNKSEDFRSPPRNKSTSQKLKKILKESPREKKNEYAVSFNDIPPPFEQTNDKKFPFLKRKSHNPSPQKLNLKEVTSKVKCWNSPSTPSKNQPSRSRSPFERTKSISQASIPKPLPKHDKTPPRKVTPSRYSVGAKQSSPSLLNTLPNQYSPDLKKPNTSPPKPRFKASQPKPRPQSQSYSQLHQNQIQNSSQQSTHNSRSNLQKTGTNSSRHNSGSPGRKSMPTGTHLEELESAYSSSFMPKFERTFQDLKNTRLQHLKSGHSDVPTLLPDAKFFVKYNTSNYEAHSKKRYVMPSDAKCTLYFPSPRVKSSQTPKIRIREITLSKNNISKALQYQDRVNLAKFQTFGSSKQSYHPRESHETGSSSKKPINIPHNRPESINYIIPTAMPSQNIILNPKKKPDTINNKENVTNPLLRQANQPSQSSAASRDGLPPLSSGGKQSVQNTPDWRSNSKGSSDPQSISTLTKHENFDYGHNPATRSTTPSKMAVTSGPIPLPNAPNFMKHIDPFYGIRSNDSTLRENNFRTNHALINTEPNSAAKNLMFNTPSKTESADRYDSTDRSRSKEIPARKHRLLLSSSAKKLRPADSYGLQESTLFTTTHRDNNSTTALLLQTGSYNNPFADGSTKIQELSQSVKKELTKLSQLPIPLISTAITPNTVTINNYLSGINSGNVTGSSIQSKPSPQDSKIPRLPGLAIPIRKAEDIKLSDYSLLGDKNRSQQPLIDNPLTNHPINDSRGSSISGIPHSSSRPYTVDNSLQIDTNLLRDTSSSPINAIVNSILYKNSSPGYPSPIVQAIKSEIAASTYRSKHDTFGLESDPHRSSKLSTFRDNNYPESAKISQLSNRSASPLLDSNMKGISARLDFGEMPQVQKVLLKDYLSPRNANFPDPPRLSPVGKIENKAVLSPFLTKSPLREEKVTPIKADQSPSPKPTPNVVSPKKFATPTSSPQKYSNPFSPMAINKEVGISKKSPKASPQNRQFSPQVQSVSPKNAKEKSPSNSSAKKTPPKDKFPIFKITTPEEKSPQKSLGSPKEKFHLIKVNSPENRMHTSPDQSNRQYSVRSPTIADKYTTNRDGSPAKSATERKSPVNKTSVSPKGKNLPPLDSKSPKASESKSPKSLQSKSPKGIDNKSPKSVESKSPKAVESKSKKGVFPKLVQYSIPDKYTRLKSPSAEKASKTTSIPEKSIRSPKDETSMSMSKSKPERKSVNKSSYTSERSLKEIPVIDDKPHEAEEYFLMEASPIIEQFPAISDPKFDPIIEKSGERLSSIRSSPKSEDSIKLPSPKKSEPSIQNPLYSPQRETKSLSPLKLSPGPTKITSPIKQKFPSPKKEASFEKNIQPFGQIGTSISSNEEQSPFIKFLKDSSRELSQNRKLLKKSTAKFPIKIIEYPESSRKTPEIDLFSGIIGPASGEKRIPQTVTAYELALSKVFPSKSPLRGERRNTPHSVKNFSNRSLQDSKAYNSERSYEAAFAEAKNAHQEFINQSSQQNVKGNTQTSFREQPSAETALMSQIHGNSQIQQDPMIISQLQSLAQVKEDMLISLTEAKLQKIQDVFVQKIDSIHKDLLTRIEGLQNTSNTNNSTNTHSQPSNNNTQKSSAHSHLLESERPASKSPIRTNPIEKSEKISKSPLRSNESSKIMNQVPESNTESESYYPKPSSEEKLQEFSSDDNKRIPGKSKISSKVKKLIKGAGGNTISQKKLTTLLESDKKDNMHRFSFGGAHDPSKRVDSSPNKIPMTNKEVKKALHGSPSTSPQKNADSTIKSNTTSLVMYQKLLGESPMTKNTPPKKKRVSPSPGSAASSENGSPQRIISESPLLPKIDLYAKIKNPSLKKLRQPSPAGYETSPQKSKPVTPAKNVKTTSSKKDTSPDTVYSQLKAKGTPQTKSSKTKKAVTNSNSRAISPSDIKTSPLHSASKLMGLNPNLEGSHFMTHVELFPSTERYGRSARDRDRIHPVPQIRGLESLNPLENHVVIDEKGIHSPPHPNYPTLEKELEEAFEAAAEHKDHSGSKYENLIAPKLQTKTGPTLLTSSNLMTLSPEKTSETRQGQPHLDKHYIQTELNHPKPIKGTSADTELTNKSASFKQKENPINFEKEEEAYLRRVFSQKQATISPIVASKSHDPKASGSSFGALKPKYQEELIENIPPQEQQEIKNMKRIGSRQNSLSKNDPSPLFYFEKESTPHVSEIPSGLSAYSSAQVDNSSSLPAVGETAFEREKRLRDEIKYLKSKLKDLTVKGVGVSPNKLIKAKSKKLKAKNDKSAAKTFDEIKEGKSLEPNHKRQRSTSKSVPKSREHTPNNALSKKMSASVVEGGDIECRKLSNTPIKIEMQRNASANLAKKKNSIEDLNKKMSKTSTTSKLKQNAINKAQEKFFEEYSNKINDNDIKKVSNKNLEIEEVMRVGRGGGMVRSSSVKASKH